MKQYRVTYLAEAGGGQAVTRAITVNAPNPDAARREALRLDPKYIATTRSPKEIKP